MKPRNFPAKKLQRQLRAKGHACLLTVDGNYYGDPELESQIRAARNKRSKK